MMNNLITNKPSMTSLEIAELVEKRHDNVKRTIVTLASKDVIRSPQIEVLERINNLGFAVNDEVYKFSGEEGKRDSIIVVAQLSPEFTARLVDRWKELEEERSRPKSQAELIAEMALLNVEQERRLYQVEEQVETVVEAVENIKRGNMRAGYVGYRQVVAKSGMTDAKCRNLVNAYRIPTDTHEFMTPDGLLSRRAIVEFEPFMKAFRQMMAEAEPRGARWYHPKMGLFRLSDGRKNIVKVEFNDQGSVSVITVTSTVFEFRRHNRAIDVALFLTPEITSQSSGFFIMKTILSGKTHHALRAYKHLIREAKR